MRTSISYAALAVALAAGTTAANAQTVISRQISEQPVETVVTEQPVTSVHTTRVGTARPVLRRRVVTTRRTTITQRVLPPGTVPANLARTVPPPVAATTIAADSAPLYDVVPGTTVINTPPPGPFFASAPVATTAPPLYDEVDTAAIAPPAPVASTIPTYRYVYEPDRILVIDPSTNIAIQALPR
jgi:hypothetical protein